MFIRPSHSYARASILKTGVLLPTVPAFGWTTPCSFSCWPSGTLYHATCQYATVKKQGNGGARERERIEPSNLGAWLGRPVVGPPSLLRPPGVAVQKLASPFACALPAAQACALQGCSCSRLPAEVQRQRQGSGPAPLDAPLEPRTEHCRYQGSERES